MEGVHIIQPVARPASPPPFGEIQIRYAHPISPGCHQLYVVIVANGCGYTQGPFWLPWRIALVGWENRIEAMKKLPDVRFLFSSLTTPPFMAAKTRIQRCLCREVGGIWQCRMGRNLMTFDKDHGTAEEGLQKQSSCSQAYGFATITMYSWWQPGEIGCAYRI
jgi:hypothetical protein